MTDELDQQAAKYIEAARKTVAKMNDKRSPLTKLFDQIRSEFTRLEGEIDPSKTGTVPNQLQQLRNRFAAQKREEEERRRREEMMRQQIEQAVTQFRTDLENDWRYQLGTHIQQQCNDMSRLLASVTLDNYIIVEEQFKKWDMTFPKFTVNVTKPFLVPEPEHNAIMTDVWNTLKPGFTQQYAEELAKYRDSCLDRLPSKKQELERAAQASAEEAERIRREMEERDRAEAARQEAERKEAERKQREAAELKKQQTEMGSLFDQQAVAATTPVVEGCKPKTSVKQKLVPLAPEAFTEIFAMWWSGEGCKMTVEELTKVFKKQITYCEKLANSKTNPVQIKSELISYEDDVRAK
ncbi:MAG: hypothetical protein IIZ69_13835 [Pseudomonas sp.]|nr:hypothetical protein [Pseudomonas sp.]